MAELRRLVITHTDLYHPNTQAFNAWLDTASDKPGGVETCE